MAVNVSPAYLFRKVAADAPTILFDEVDTVFINMASSGASTEEVRGLLNAGHRVAGVTPTRWGEAARLRPLYSIDLHAISTSRGHRSRTGS